MTQGNEIGRGLRITVGKLLRSDTFHKALSEWGGFSPRKVVNPLFSYLYSTDDLLKWRAVTAMGQVVARLADEDMESARNIMRRLIWNLNDESGGIGWGSPEAMGEIMASHQKMADEFSRILLSYIREDGNPIENEMLQRGVLWGLGRLAQARPHLLRDCAGHILPYLKSGDPVLRGHAVWMLGFLRTNAARPGLEALLADENEILIFENCGLHRYRIGDLAARALGPPVSIMG